MKDGARCFVCGAAIDSGQTLCETCKQVEEARVKDPYVNNYFSLKEDAETERRNSGS